MEKKTLFERLVAPFLLEPTSFATYEKLYLAAHRAAVERGLDEERAAWFASWAATMAGWSEPVPLPAGMLGRLNQVFARAAWGEGAEHYLPRLESIAAGAEGDYEAALEAVIEEVRKWQRK